MSFSSVSRYFVVLLCLAAVGCSSTVKLPDGTEMPEKTYMAQQQQAASLELAAKFSEAFKAPDAELSEAGEMMHGFQNILAMVMMPQIAQSMQQDGYWQYESAKLSFWGNIIAGPASALLQPFANRLAYGKRGSAYGQGGYTELNFGNRVAKGGGSGGGEKGVSGGASASGDTEFSDMYFTLGDKSPFQYGDGTLLYGKDSQFQTGNGFQGQEGTSRPNNQPNPQTEGGPINNNSEGLGFDGSL